MIARGKNRFSVSVTLWWVFWLLSAALSENFSIDKATVILVLISIFSFQIGASLGSGVAFGFSRARALENTRLADGRLSIFNSTMVPRAILAVQLFLFALSVRGYFKFDNFREAVFENSADIWGSLVVIYIYDMLIFPIAIVYAVNSLRTQKIFEKNKNFIFLFFFLDSLIKLGRFSLYIYFLIMVAALITGRVKATTTGAIKVGSVLFFLGLFIFAARYDRFSGFEVASLALYVFDSIVAYHMVGFALLNQFVTGATTFSGEAGVLWLGFIEGLFGRLISAIGFSYESQFSTFGMYLQGVTIQTSSAVYNAFGTNVLPFYLDGGAFFSAIAFLFIGFVMTCGAAGEGRVGLSRVGYIIWIVMMLGIFQSFIIGPLFYSCLFLIVADNLLCAGLKKS